MHQDFPYIHLFSALRIFVTLNAGRTSAWRLDGYYTVNQQLLEQNAGSRELRDTLGQSCWQRRKRRKSRIFTKSHKCTRDELPLQRQLTGSQAAPFRF